MINRLCALSILLFVAGCATDANVRVGLSNSSVPATAEWADLPEHVRAQYVAMAEVADPDQQLDRPPYPIGGMAGLMSGLTYPEEARRAGIEGRVIVRAVIAADGSVDEADILHPVHPLLDAEALAAVRRGAFEPATRDGQAVAAEICAPIKFRLR